MAEQKAEEKLKLYANPICPFAQRAWISLEVKKVPYEYVKCSLGSDADKEDYFKEAYAKAVGRDENSVGKVPIVQTTDGKFITESDVVSRYIDYAYSDDKYTSLLPSDAFERAAVETMIGWIGDSGWIRSHYGNLMQCNPEKSKAMAAEWKKKWETLEKRLGQLSEKGLFLGGDRISLFDIFLYPFFDRLCTIEEYPKIPVLSEWLEKEFPRIKSWYDTMRANEGVKKTIQTPESLIEAYKGYRERGQKAYEAEKAKQAEATK